MESKVKKILTLVDFCQLGEERRNKVRYLQKGSSISNLPKMPLTFQQRDIPNLSKND
jgi:hypothetical protein